MVLSFRGVNRRTAKVALNNPAGMRKLCELIAYNLQCDKLGWSVY